MTEAEGPARAAMGASEGLRRDTGREASATLMAAMSLGNYEAHPSGCEAAMGSWQPWAQAALKPRTQALQPLCLAVAAVAAE